MILRRSNKRFSSFFFIIFFINLFILDCVHSSDAIDAKTTTGVHYSETKQQNDKKSENILPTPMIQSKQLMDDEKIFTSLVKSIFKTTSSGLKSGFEASVRSLFDKPISGAVAAVSMIIGAVAMLAFYESPISPLPVPPLPDPPVGRFPPEHPIWPPPPKVKPNAMPYGAQPYKRSGGPGAVVPYNHHQGFINDINNNYHPQMAQIHPIFYPINHIHRSDAMRINENRIHHQIAVHPQAQVKNNNQRNELRRYFQMLKNSESSTKRMSSAAAEPAMKNNNQTDSS